MRRLAMLAGLGLLMGSAGCFTPSEDFQAMGSSPWLYSGYDYEGRTATQAEGSLDVSLDTDGNSGHIRAVANDLFHTTEIRWHSYAGRQPYQSGGVARDIDLWGATGNGSGAFPRVTAYAAAFGNATLIVDGKELREPRALSPTYAAIFFLARGHYRDNDSHQIETADQNGTFNPENPADGFVNRLGAQAAILLFTERGELAKYVEFNDVRIGRR